MLPVSISNAFSFFSFSVMQVLYFDIASLCEFVA